MRTYVKTGKPAYGGNETARGRRSDRRPVDTRHALRVLAQTYEQVGDHLLDRMHACGSNLRAARAISRHLDWVGARAQVVNSFIAAGDGALHYLCADSEAPERLASLVQLTARNAVPERLSVALFLMEKIDEELHLS